MIHGKKILAVIPARGNSKTIQNKNLKQINGKPLIAWTIEEAKKSKYIDRLVLSSDNQNIIDFCRANGCEVPFKRPDELALDDTPGIEPILHTVKMIPHYDYVVVLQPTSPLRIVDDIDGCIENCVINDYKCVVTVTSTFFKPYWSFTMDEGNKMNPLFSDPIPKRRQDHKDVYALNGAVYIAKIDYLLEHRSFITDLTFAYKMPRIRSIDIDDYEDFIIAEHFMSFQYNRSNINI